MKIPIYYSMFILILLGCSSETESILPTIGTITESVYASGTIESDDQYQVFPSVNGIIQEVYVTEGDQVHANSNLFAIFNAYHAIKHYLYYENVFKIRFFGR